MNRWNTYGCYIKHPVLQSHLLNTALGEIRLDGDIEFYQKQLAWVHHCWISLTNRDHRFCEWYKDNCLLHKQGGLDSQFPQDLHW